MAEESFLEFVGREFPRDRRTGAVAKLVDYCIALRAVAGYTIYRMEKAGIMDDGVHELSEALVALRGVAGEVDMGDGVADGGDDAEGR